MGLKPVLGLRSARRIAVVALAAGAALTVAACGGGGSSGTTAQTPATQPPATSGPPPATSGAPETGATETTGGGAGGLVTDYVAYTGATPGKADPSKSPIVIGWVNGQGGQGELPQATAGAQAAVKYVNEALGGIDGHPLALHTCFIAQAEEEGQKCGQELMNDNRVSIIAFGAVVTGNQSLHSVINGRKPIIVGVSANPADNTAKNTFALYGTQTSVLPPWGTFIRDVLHKKSAAIVYPSQAGANTAADATKAGLEAAGIEVKSVGYDPNSTDLVGPLTAAGGQNADVIVPMTDPPGCVNLAKAIQQLGLKQPVVSNPLCLGAQWPGDLPHWIFGIAQSLPGDPTAADSVYYLKTATQYGLKPADAQNVFAQLGWAEILEITKWMNAVGADNITPETMTEQIKAFKGPLIMGAPTVNCGYDPSQPAACNDSTKFYQYEGKGKFVAVSGFLHPPK